MPKSQATPMRCPHCLTAFKVEPKIDEIHGAEGKWTISLFACPACDRDIIFLTIYAMLPDQIRDATTMVYPKGSNRPVPKEVPRDLARDFAEAALVLPDSPKASAALSRRCLQHLLREYFKVTKNDLSHEIDQVLNSKQLPNHLAEQIDGIRNIGNFSAHPIKSTNTGEIEDVEPGEAEWNLDTLEGLFDYCYVAPARTAAKKAALNKKLAKAGEKPMKEPKP